MKHSQKWRYSALMDDDETRLLVAKALAAEERAGTLHLIAGTNEPRPRLVEWSDAPDGLLVATDRARFIVRVEDEAGLMRLVSMLRTEFAAGVVGNC